MASSRIRIGGSFRTARAIAIRCRWPPESAIPRSPPVRRVQAPEADVLAHRILEEDRLWHQADPLAQRRPGYVRDGDAVDEDFAILRLVEAVEEVCHGGLAAAAPANECGDPSARRSRLKSRSTGAPARSRR